MKTFKLNSAFGALLIVILFFLLNGIVFNLFIFYIIAFVLMLFLPACSTKE